MAQNKIYNKTGKNPELSITIPIYNEEKNIGATVTHLSEYLDKIGLNYELVLVNHGSSDKTKDVLELLYKKNKRLKIFNLEKNLGYGGGIMFGFKHSDGDIIGWVCADEDASPEDVYKIYLGLKNTNYDVSKAIRIKRKDGIFRIITTLLFRVMTNLRFGGLKIKDVNGYPFFMRREIMQKVLAKETTYLFNLDLLRNIRKNKFKLIEIPIENRKRKTGKSFMKPKRITEMVWKLIVYSMKA
jgi:glycosyltransferase involved in cell wall biosynthesis